MVLQYLVMDSGCNAPIGITFPTNACNILLSGVDDIGGTYLIPSNSAIWTSNNPSVAAPFVSTDGLIMGYSNGIAIITATYFGKSVSKSVTVGTGIQNPSGINFTTYALVASGFAFLYLATRKK